MSGVAATALPDALGRALAHAVSARTSVLLQREITQADSYISGTGERKSLVPRGEIQTETDAETTYVRVYQTVYAAVEGASKWKDVHQKPDGRIEVRGTGDMWLNAGRPWRAFHYVRTYLAQAPGKALEAIDERGKAGPVSEEEKEAIRRKHGRPVIRSFLIPYETYMALTSMAISEKQVEEYGKRHNLSVDKTKDSDQFLVRGRDVKVIRAMAKPHSLVSYVLDAHLDEYAHRPVNGTVKPMTELLKELGMPLALSDPLLLPLTPKNTMQKDPVQVAHAEKLHELYQLSFELEREQPHAETLERLAVASQALLGISSWPADAAERTALRERIAAAATYALMPSVLRENYEEATAHMYGSDTVDGKPISAWMSKQRFATAQIAPIPAKQAPSAEAIAAKEEKDRAKTAAREAKREVEVDLEELTLFGGDDDF